MLAKRAVGFVFPGQGSHRSGMLDVLPPSPDVERLLDAAEALTGQPLREIAAEGPDESLAATLVAQPLLYITGWGWANAVENAGVAPVAVAGHSLGELAALAYAGVFSVEAGLELVCERARLMGAATASHPGAMAAVIGMDADIVSECAQAVPGVWVANDNAPGQIVLSGTYEGIEAATRVLSEAGARKVVPLNVAGGFHSPLMADAAASFADIVRGASFADARIPVIQNAGPAPATDAGVLRDRLIAQMASAVRWTDTMSAMKALGVDLLVETGPGAVLTGLARRVADLESIAVETDGIDRVVEVASS